MKACGCALSSQINPQPTIQQQPPKEENIVSKRKRKVYKPRKKKQGAQVFTSEPEDTRLNVNDSGRNYLVTTKIYKPLPNFILKKPQY